MFKTLNSPRLCRLYFSECIKITESCPLVHVEQLNYDKDIQEFYSYISTMQSEYFTKYMNDDYEDILSEWRFKSFQLEEYNNWRIEHINASYSGIILDDFKFKVEVLCDDLYSADMYLTENMLWKFSEILDDFEIIKKIISAKEIILAESTMKSSQIIQLETIEFDQIKELWLRTCVVKSFPQIKSFTDLICEICLTEEKEVDGVYIDKLAICRSCIIQHLRHLGKSTITDDINHEPVITGITKTSNYKLSFNSLVDTLLTFDLTPAEMKIIISIQKHVTQIFSKSVYFRTKRETEQECEIGDFKKKTIARLQKLMTLTCPNPLCERAFDDWNSCAALVCEPYSGERLPGFCGINFCAVCGMSSADDIHEHVKICIKQNVTELIKIGAIEDPMRDLSYYIPQEIKPRLILYRKVKAIKLVVSKLPEEEQHFYLNEMGKLYPELLEACFHFTN